MVSVKKITQNAKIYMYLFEVTCLEIQIFYLYTVEPR